MAGNSNPLSPLLADEDEDTVVVNLTSGATTRVSLPGTPTSIVSARSSQDSASSASSTKQLLSHQQQPPAAASGQEGAFPELTRAGYSNLFSFQFRGRPARRSS